LSTAPTLPPALEALQQRIGHVFRDRSLLLRALTHRSHGADHNERLEFLGDAVLNVAVSDLLFDQYDDSPEGDLTRVRAHLVRQDMLHRLALSLQLPSVLRLSEGEARGGGAQRPSILADAMEAIIGAVYRDAGFDAAQALVRRLFEPLVSETATQAWAKDSKTQLQEWLQARRQSVPDYRIETTRGRAHDQTFVVVCSVPGFGVEGQGEGRSRRAAEQEAARQVLMRLAALPE
jgi:ribonuclease-3